VAWHVQRDDGDVSDRKLIAVLEEPIELRAVPREVGASVEQFSEDVLDADDFPADRELAAQVLLEIGRGRQVIGVSVGLQEPIDD
jgi:hypothetical protein